jgi:hypothetical protein
MPPFTLPRPAASIQLIMGFLAGSAFLTTAIPAVIFLLGYEYMLSSRKRGTGYGTLEPSGRRRYSMRTLKTIITLLSLILIAGCAVVPVAPYQTYGPYYESPYYAPPVYGYYGYYGSGHYYAPRYYGYYGAPHFYGYYGYSTGRHHN